MLASSKIFFNCCVGSIPTMQPHCLQKMTTTGVASKDVSKSDLKDVPLHFGQVGFTIRKNLKFDGAKLLKKDTPAGAVLHKKKLFDNQAFAGFSQKKSQKNYFFVVHIKKCCIFAPDFEPVIDSRERNGIFYACNKKSLTIATLRVAVAKYYLAGSKTAIVFFIVIDFRTQMNQPSKTANGAIKVTSFARQSHETATSTKMPRLNLTGIENDYLYCIRKIFRNFIKAEHHNAAPNYSLYDLTKEVRAARVLFAEDRDKLHKSLTRKKIKQ